MRLHKCNNSTFPLPVFQMDYKLPDLPDVKIQIPHLTDEYWAGVAHGLRAHLNLQLTGFSLAGMKVYFGDLCREIDRIEKFRHGSQKIKIVTKPSKFNNHD